MTSSRASTLATWRRRLRAFHEGEDGIETLNVVMIVGVSALILAAIVLAWPTIRDYFKGGVNKVIKDDALNANETNPL
jgi:hypothetical protein